jgi:hypothetical protein
VTATVQDSDAKAANGASGSVTSKAFTAAVDDVILIGAFGGYTAAANVSVANGTVADGGGTFTTDAVGAPDPDASQQNCGLRISARRLTTAGSYTFTAASTNEVVAFFLLLRGADPTAFVDSYSLTATGQGTGLQSNAASAVSPAGADDLLVGFFGSMQFVGATTWTAPSGMTELFDTSSPNGFLTCCADTQVLAASGTTGTRTAASTRGSGDTINGQARALVAIKSAAVAGAQTGKMLLAAP